MGGDRRGGHQVVNRGAQGDDMDRLREAGVRGMFTPGTSLAEIADWVRENVLPRTD